MPHLQCEKAALIHLDNSDKLSLPINLMASTFNHWSLLMRDVPKHIQPSDFQQKCQNYMLEKRQMVFEKLDIHLEKSKARPLSLILYKS
jgi:hypothetical protein